MAGCRSRGLFSDGSLPLMLQPRERFGIAECLMRRMWNLQFFCWASATVGSTGAGKTEPQKQQQLGTAGYAMFATVEVA
jgi:hypothetical protein